MGKDAEKHCSKPRNAAVVADTSQPHTLSRPKCNPLLSPQAAAQYVMGRGVASTLWRRGTALALVMAAVAMAPGARASSMGSESEDVGVVDPHCAANKCLELYRMTLGCVMDGNTSCGECLPGFVGTRDVSTACVEGDPEDAGYPQYGVGENKRIKDELKEAHSLGMQAGVATAIGSLVMVMMCVVLWNGWVDCFKHPRQRQRQRAFAREAAKEWQCACCLHENSSLRHRCVICGSEISGTTVATAATQEAATRSTSGAYSSIQTPRHEVSTLRRCNLHMQGAGSHGRGADRLEWKRYVTNEGVRWVRFEIADVRRHRKLRGTFVTSTSIPVDESRMQRRTSLCSRRSRSNVTPSMAPTDGFFVRVDNQSVVEWVAVDRATRDAQMYKHWRRLPDAAALPFHDRVQWLHQELLKLRDPLTRSVFTLHVSRESVLHQSVEILTSLSPSMLRRGFRVSFANESGVDGGGIFREWLQLVCKAFFSESTGLFQRVQSSSDNGAYWIKSKPRHPSSSDQQLYTFFGRLLGKIILEGLVLNVRLSTPLLKHILGYPLSLEDVRSIDEQLHASIEYILTNDGVDQLNLTFAVPGRDLIPSGADVPVRDSNKRLYVDLLVRYYLFDSIQAELSYILAGLRSVIPDKLLHVLDYRELALVISGLQEIDVLDWQAHTVVNMLGHRPELEQQVVDWFWEVIATMDQHQRGRLLQYVTGSSGVPVEGFQALTSLDGRLQPFTIQLAERGSTTFATAPYASTCFNRFDLPVYESKRELQEMLHLLVSMDVTGFNRR